MSVITNLERWGNNHRPGFLDIFRFFLGAFITYKGLYFITHMPELEMTTAGINVYFAGTTLALPAVAKLRHTADEEAALTPVLDRFARWHTVSTAWQVAAFVALVVALAYYPSS